MAEKIRVNYAALESMAAQCQKVAQELQQTAQNADKWAQMMQNGALQGPPGDTFVQALGVLKQKLLKLSAQFETENKDIHDAMTDMQTADGRAGGNF